MVIAVGWSFFGDCQFLVRLEPPTAFFPNQNSYAAFLNLARRWAPRAQRSRLWTLFCHITLMNFAARSQNSGEHIVRVSEAGR
jgi:hypothetical protein